MILHNSDKAGIMSWITRQPFGDSQCHNCIIGKPTTFC